MKIYVSMALVVGSMMFQSVVAAETRKPANDRAAWLDEAKFGLFIHWGLYSQLARGECRVPTDEENALSSVSVANPPLFQVRSSPPSY